MNKRKKDILYPGIVIKSDSSAAWQKDSGISGDERVYPFSQTYCNIPNR